MAITKLRRPDRSTLELVKTVCYPCTSQQNDCSRRLNNEQITVEKCNNAYNTFGINPPPADYRPGKQAGGGGGWGVFMLSSSSSLSFICLIFIFLIFR